MTGFSETGDHAPVEYSCYLQASGGRYNHGLKPARYHFVIRAILKHEKSLEDMDFSDGWAYSHSMLAGGLVVTSRTTRLTWGTSLTMRAEITRTTS